MTPVRVHILLAPVKAFVVPLVKPFARTVLHDPARRVAEPARGDFASRREYRFEADRTGPLSNG